LNLSLNQTGPPATANGINQSEHLKLTRKMKNLIVAKTTTMNDLDKVFQSLLTGVDTNSIIAMQKIQEKAEHQMQMILYLQIFQGIIGTILTAYVVWWIWNWMKNTEKHLKTISDSARQMTAEQGAPAKVISKHTAENNPTAKPYSPPILNQNPRQQPAKVQTVPADSFEHPHSRYMPKK